MTYRKKNILDKPSITKKCAWSLILAAKCFRINNFDNESQVTIEKSLNKKTYKYEYDLEKKEVEYISVTMTKENYELIPNELKLKLKVNVRKNDI